MKKPTAPCQGCKRRNAECHAHCRKYKAYEKARKEYYSEKKTQTEVSEDLASYYEDKSKRLKRIIRENRYRSRT